MTDRYEDEQRAVDAIGLHGQLEVARGLIERQVAVLEVEGRKLKEARETLEKLHAASVAAPDAIDVGKALGRDRAIPLSWSEWREACVVRGREEMARQRPALDAAVSADAE